MIESQAQMRTVYSAASAVGGAQHSLTSGTRLQALEHWTAGVQFYQLRVFFFPIHSIQRLITKTKNSRKKETEKKKVEKKSDITSTSTLLYETNTNNKTNFSE